MLATIRKHQVVKKVNLSVENLPVIFKRNLFLIFTLKIMASQSVYEAAHKGDFDFVRTKLEEDQKLLNTTDSNNRLLIHWAVLSGNVKLVEYLIELGSPTDPADDTDSTPIILASSAGHTEVDKILLKKKVDVNQKTSNGHSSLQYAASKGWTEICSLLLKYGANINITDSRGSTPLHRAASKGKMSVVQLFLEYIDKLKINHKDAYGNSALHLACEEDRQDVALLLFDNGADIEAQNREGLTPLDLCSMKLARLLKAKGEQ